MSPIDHRYTDEIVCPYCGYEHGDSWESVATEDPTIRECWECEKEFKFWHYVERTFLTKKMDKETK